MWIKIKDEVRLLFQYKYRVYQNVVTLRGDILLEGKTGRSGCQNNEHYYEYTKYGDKGLRFVEFVQNRNLKLRI